MSPIRRQLSPRANNSATSTVGRSGSHGADVATGTAELDGGPDAGKTGRAVSFVAPGTVGGFLSSPVGGSPASLAAALPTTEGAAPPFSETDARSTVSG